MAFPSERASLSSHPVQPGSVAAGRRPVDDGAAAGVFHLVAATAHRFRHTVPVQHLDIGSVEPYTILGRGIDSLPTAGRCSRRSQTATLTGAAGLTGALGAASLPLLLPPPFCAPLLPFPSPPYPLAAALAATGPLAAALSAAFPFATAAAGFPSPPPLPLFPWLPVAPPWPLPLPPPFPSPPLPPPPTPLPLFPLSPLFFARAASM